MVQSDILYEKCKKSKDPETIQTTIGAMKIVLKASPNGVGISANQIGINESISIIKVKKEIILVNPEIVEHSEETFVFHEGCLSFPNSYVQTHRYKRVVVKSDNNDIMEFVYRDFDELNNLELACVQHEIDHLNGITMFDRKQ
jgi:peptide deformylase